MPGDQCGLLGDGICVAGEEKYRIGSPRINPVFEVITYECSCEPAIRAPTPEPMKEGILVESEIENSEQSPDISSISAAE